ncbi:MAG: hypothetical protein ACXWBQ_09995 [Usitatibacter sp.]
MPAAVQPGIPAYADRAFDLDQFRPRAVSALGVVASLALSAGAATCPKATYFTARVVDPGTVSATVDGDDISIASDGLRVRVFGCGVDNAAPERQPKSLCVTIAARPLSVVYIPSPDLLFIAADGSRIAMPLGSLEYTIPFFEGPDGKEVPSSPTVSPVNGKQQCRDGKRVGKARTRFCRFDASREFLGARNTARFFIKDAADSATWREYQGKADLPPSAGGRFTVSLPSIEVSRKEENLPMLEFTRTTGTACPVDAR